MDEAPNCAICDAPAYPECPCESARLKIAVKQAEQRAMDERLADIRAWVINHARGHILEAFKSLSSIRKQAHSSYLASLPHYDTYMRYSGRPPISPTYVATLQKQIQEAHVELKRGIDADWRATVLRYPVVLDYFYSLVELRLPNDRSQEVVQPPFAVAGYADRGYDREYIDFAVVDKKKKKRKDREGSAGLDRNLGLNRIMRGPPPVPTPPLQHGRGYASTNIDDAQEWTQWIGLKGMPASESSHTHEVHTGPSNLKAERELSLPAATNPFSPEKEECMEFELQPGADYDSTECHCLSSANLPTDSVLRHVLNELAGKLPDAWEDIQDQLPESYKWDIEYVATHSHSAANTGCWTCAPLEVTGSIPLTIASAPVVLPVEHQWPPVGGLHPPPDPRPSAPINCWTELPLDAIRDIFLTYEGSLGFYVLTSGFLQIIVAEGFDTTWASSHLPHRYGGLKVCYIVNTIEPTMLQSNIATSSRTNASLQTQTSRVPSTSTQAQSIQSLQLNDFIEARVSSTSREKFAGRIGLKVEKDGQPYLVMSSHIITEAILSRSFFGLNRDPMKRLREDWNKNVEIWAGNAKIGMIERSYDQAAEHYPTGFNHDVTLIRPNTTASVAEVKSPIGDIGWLRRDAWSTLRQQPSGLKILSPTNANRAAKCIKCNTPSETVIVGEGIFFNQTAAAGSKPARNHDLETWSRFVSRAILYRVNPDFNPSTGHSGIALYAEGAREDGTHGPGIVGFQSFVQRSDHPQKFNMPEGPHLEQRLKQGRVAFYGAFQIPDELRGEYSIL